MHEQTYSRKHKMGEMETMGKNMGVVTLKQYAERHGLDVKRLRRVARKNEWPSDVKPFKFGGDDGIWAIDANAPMVTLPTKSTRGSRRPDGRQRYIVFANETELAAIANVVGDDNVINPRVAAKLRRDARKLANVVDDDNADAEYVKMRHAMDNDVDG